VEKEAHVGKGGWELIVLDGDSGRAIPGDFDGDGRTEVVSGTKWYRPSTFERSVIDGGISLRCVGATAGDLDGDGVPEVIGSTRRDTEDRREYYALYWYKAQGTGPNALSAPWAAHKICDEQLGQPHDIVVADVDGDGRNELVVVRMYIATPGVYIYRPGPDITQPWQETAVQVGTSGDGTIAADLDSDGVAEIVAGPYLYVAPPQGPFAGPWQRTDLATDFREMCKAAVLDVTGDGRPDVIIAESEYPDCRVSWFENRADGWVEHPLEELDGARFNFVHSLDAWHDADGTAHIFLAEMNEGGWNAGYNHDARLVLYSSADRGSTWEREIIYRGFGTWEAVAHDVDDDGEIEIVGIPAVTGDGIYVWKERKASSFPVRYRHRFLDREKGWTGTDILAVDVDGDGRQDVVCAAWWYRAPTWERRRIPGVYQIVNAYDIDGDGRDELIGTKAAEVETDNWYAKLSSEMVWLKPIDPLNGRWQEHYIGTATPGKGGHGWPHGTAIAPVLPGGKVAFVAMGSGPLELYEVPDDPAQPWPKRTFSEAVDAASHMIPVDLTGNGLLDLVAMWTWLENLGDGSFRSHRITDRYVWSAARPSGFRGGEQLIADVNGNGLPDLVACEEHVEWGAEPQVARYVRLAWFEHPGDPRQTPWEMHVIDCIRSPHSLAVADLNGDGELEIVCGEHDPFKPYRARSKVYVYKKADPKGRAWTRHVVDDRFDNHVGTRLIELGAGRLGIISHGWVESKYVHLWEPEEGQT
jgi:hypothetical protein